MNQSMDEPNRRGILSWLLDPRSMDWTWRVLPWLMALVVLRVTALVVSNYGDYWPPNFRSDFLVDRDPYFWGAYSCAFYIHIITGPMTLVVGLVLLNKTFLRTFPKWHRFLGRMQVMTILFLMTPSGFWMAWYAVTGTIAGLGFACLAIATASCAAMGWRRAMQRRFQEHQRWMWRCYLLMCSAVVLRLTAGLTIVAGVEREWVYPMSAWSSWMAPLLLFEAAKRRDQASSRTAEQ